MRVVLDACVPRGMGKLLQSHQVTSAQSLGFGDLDDRPLLDALEGRCDALITVDRRLPQQQRIVGRSLAVIVIRARSNRLEDLAPLAGPLLALLEVVRSGEVREVGV